MLTIIRTSPKRIQYCGRTIDNLIESNKTGNAEVHVVSSSSRTPNQNAMEQLRVGIKSGHEWLILMEDDLSFIADFDESVRLWLRDCEGSDSLCYPLAAAYKQVREQKGIAWKYPVELFYGTQAVAIRQAQAKSLLAFIEAIPKIPSKGFDMLIKQWAEANKAKHFLTPVPSFVQHVGVESSLHLGRYHWFGSWPGRDWSYVTRSTAFSPAEQKNRPFDEKLADALVEYFGEGIVYDCGCSTGNYIRHMTEGGTTMHGFEITPGCASEMITECDLSKPLTFVPSFEPAGVMCLEVAEHIHPDHETDFLQNLNSLCKDKLVISWAVPGQGGNRHVNERDSAYVKGRISEMGFKFDKATSQKLRDAATISWFKNTVYVFTR